jgi:hypothetical protein
VIGELDTPDVASDVAVLGGFAYVTDRGHGLRVIDVRVPGNPKLSTVVDTGGDTTSVDSFGNYLYVADRESGLRVVDVTDPTNPRLVGGNSAFGLGYDVTVANGKVFVASSEGLMVLNLYVPVASQLAFDSMPDRQAGGTSLALRGLPGLPVELQKSSNLLNWEVWTNAVLSDGRLELVDPTVSSGVSLFYRARAR